MAESALERELRAARELTEWVRQRLYEVPEGGWRSAATTAVAAAAAQETYRLADRVPSLGNQIGQVWRGHLDRVWTFLEGDRSQYDALSHALADFLTSPFNHNEGQDGPDDFDRPQTVAGYSAVASAVMWGVDFATVAVRQIFECVDVMFEGDFPDERFAEVSSATLRMREILDRVVEASGPGRPGMTPELLAAIRA